MVVQGVNIVIGTPSFGMVSTAFYQARNSQQFPLVSSAIDCIPLNKPIAEARNMVVQFALDQGASCIYWLDDDVIAPPDAFLKMFMSGKDIVNGVYWSKSAPTMPLMFRGHLRGPYLNWHVGDFVEVDAAGNGLTYVKTDVYRRMEKELGGPWYSTEYASFPNIKHFGPNNTEDLYFYWKAKKLGYKVWVDTSIQAMHYDKSNNVFYAMPANAPQATAEWEVKPPGKKLIADFGSGPTTAYMLDEGKTVTFDIRPEARPDVLCDISKRLPVDNEIFDIIYSSHTLEHFGWNFIDKILKEWCRTLKVGGELRLVLPNLRYVAQRLLDDKIDPRDYWVLYGEQDYAKNFHAMGFTPNIIRSILDTMGIFEKIEIKEGEVDGPPNAASWNLYAKATKVRNIEVENITPDYVEAGPPMNNVIPMRVFQEYNDRPMSEEEKEQDVKWAKDLDALEWLTKPKDAEQVKELISKPRDIEITPTDIDMTKLNSLTAVPTSEPKPPRRKKTT